MTDHADAESAAALAIVAIDQVWQEARRSPWVRRDLGEPIDRLPDLGEEDAVARSARAAAMLARIGRIDAGALPAELATTLAVARGAAERMAKAGERYWLVVDPLGVGFWGLFAPTAYTGGFLFNTVAGMLAGLRFDSAGDLDRYLALIEDYARMADQMRDRTQGQAARGIVMPAQQLAQAVELIDRLAAGVAGLVPAVERLAAVGGAAARDRIATRVEASVGVAFGRLAALLRSADYRDRAPETVGMGQYPGGAALYAELVREHTTLDLSPEAVHAEGVRRMEALRARMAALLDEVGFDGSPLAYWAAVGENPAWRAEGADAIGAMFHRYIERIAPAIDGVFRFKPKAGHGVDPLPASLAGSMTFGYYDPPSPAKPTGRYLFNALNMAGGPLANVAALNYHELVPGHHFHLATQRENETLHPLRATAFFNAFNEGWAEYAATLAGELGMYREPEERFGRLVMDAFLTSRLVVDTGMNALGWSLERARDYMRANAYMPAAEIRSETIRYACDIPGQSLAYKLGEYFLRDQREVMRSRLGDRFDLRDFHDAVLKPGGLPLPLVADNVARAAAALRG